MPLASLNEVLVAGERLRITREVSRLFSALPGCELHNQYGPTETHVVASHRLSGPASDWPTHPPIGSPIDNARIHLLDGNREPVPIGVAGELYIGGECLAQGYLDRPALTAERFVPDPFTPGALLYRSGDLARRLSDGTLEFLGRLDGQLKIRGHRVEPAEVELVLLAHAQVQTAVVVADTSGRLVAYVVPSTITPKPHELAAYAAARLPEHMVPSAFVMLEALPLTPHGKVDREALPRPEQLVDRARALPPRTDMERQIAEIWAQLLRLERVGVQDDFFQSGGHSLLAMQLATRVSRAFSIRLRTRDVFESPTVAGQARLVERMMVER
jgi:acyl-coenzyme A synthetase/AMP-(fatty) acid ligase